MNLMELNDPEKLEKVTREELLQMISGMGQSMLERSRMEQKEKVRSYRDLNQRAVKGKILFTGSSLMEQFPVNEIAMSDGHSEIIYNRGIGGTNTDDFLVEIDTVLLDLKPSKLFINIGTNDMNERQDGKDWEEHLLDNYDKIMTIINERLPETKVYVMAYYPVNPEVNPQMAAYMLRTRTNEAVNRVNGEVRKLAEKHGFEYIDVNDGIKDEEGKLRSDLSKEGMHMYAAAYQIIYDALKPYLWD